MANVDFSTTVDGDLVFENGDLARVDEAQATLQEVIFRTKSDRDDYQPQLDLGAGLDQFRGWPNSRETGLAIEQATLRALTIDGKFQRDRVTVQVVPTGPHTVSLYVFVVPQFTGVFDPVRVIFDIDLNLGDITAITGGTR